MLLGKFLEAIGSRARTEAELRRWHDAELREIGVTSAEIDAFLGRRRP